MFSKSVIGLEQSIFARGMRTQALIVGVALILAGLYSQTHVYFIPALVLGVTFLTEDLEPVFCLCLGLAAMYMRGMIVVSM